ncbi:MAG: hypothetical protein ABIJ46_00500 [bacterium]
MIDENGPFSQFEKQIKESVDVYSKKVVEKFGENLTPLSSRMFPKYIANNFLFKDRFPYLTVSIDQGMDRGWSYDFIRTELDDIAIVDAIDVE